MKNVKKHIINRQPKIQIGKGTQQGPLRKQLLGVLAALSLGCFTACEDFLDPQPYSFTDGESYYSNPGQIQTAVNGIYGELQVLYRGNFYAMVEMRSDNTNYHYNEGNRGAQQREELDEFLDNPTNNYVQEVWSLMYRGVQQCNLVLDRIQDVEFDDTTVRDRAIGEASFLRAFYYFHLVRLFGDVPMPVNEIEGPDDAFTPERTPSEQVYQQILADVETAAGLLPESYGGNDLGRATRGAALTLMGEVYLTLREYSEAAEAFEQVTQLGYSLLNDYAAIYDPGNKNHAESIFEIQYSASIEGREGNFIWSFGPWHASSDLTGFSGQLQGNNIPTPDMLEAYEDGDARKETSIAYYVDESNREFEESFGDTIPFINKYYHPPFELINRTDDNWPVYRYGYLLLMYAESLNELGQTGEATVFLNRVRERAGLEPLEGLSQDQFREAVFNEIRVEVAFENHRWYQLLRTDRALEVMNEHGERERNRLSRLSAASYNVAPHMLLYPIPFREIRLNGFEQNPGW